MTAVDTEMCRPSFPFVPSSYSVYRSINSELPPNRKKPGADPHSHTNTQMVKTDLEILKKKKKS